MSSIAEPGLKLDSNGKPTAENLCDMFITQVRHYGDRTALMVKRGGRWIEISWNEFFQAVKEVSLGLDALGIGPGCIVSILSENRPEWAFTDLGTLCNRCPDAPIYATNTPDQVEYIIEHSEARIVVVSGKHQVAKVMQVWKDIPQLQFMVVMDEIELPDDKRVMSFERLRELGRKHPDQGLFDRNVAEVKPGDLATLIYTSGTTGPPKGVMLTHNNFLTNIKAVNEIITMNDADLGLSFLPLSHSLERMGGYYNALYNGGTLAYAESIDKLIDNFGEIKPTVVLSVPRIYEKMYARIADAAEKSPPLKKKMFFWAIDTGRQAAAKKLRNEPLGLVLALKYKIADKLVFHKIKQLLGGRIRFFISGGAPLAKEIAEFFYAADVLILEGYGLTETSPVITANPYMAPKFGSVGIVISGVEVKIAPDGEILCRGHNVMKGYFKNLEATIETIEPDGWFHTGDIGVIDSEGYLKITDRKKDIIVTSGGKNVAPQNIENLAKMDKFIEQIAVIGDNRKYLCALVVPDFPALEEWAREQGIPTEDCSALVQNPKVVELFQSRIDDVNSQLAKYETIKQFRLIDHEFSQDTGELTPTLKVKRRFVMTKYKDLIDSMYAAEKTPE